MNQRLQTYLLLFAFAVIFAPRSFWHSHAATEATCAHDDHSDAHEDCYICDFTLQPALAAASFQFNFPCSAGYVAPAAIVPLADVQEISLQCLRGPPVDTRIRL